MSARGNYPHNRYRPSKPSRFTKLRPGRIVARICRTDCLCRAGLTGYDVVEPWVEERHESAARGGGALRIGVGLAPGAANPGGFPRFTPFPTPPPITPP